MNWKLLNQMFAIVLAAMLCATAIAQQPEELMWDDMIPYKQDKVKSGLKGPAADIKRLVQEDPYEYLDFTQPVAGLNGRYVKIPGFIVPLESDEAGMLKEFLLVPYYGACIHTPPPPPNQIVYITFKDAINVESTYDPYWIVGTLNTKPYMSDMADAVYRLEGERIETYEE
jgi:hypothetical protein